MSDDNDVPAANTKGAVISGRGDGSTARESRETLQDADSGLPLSPEGRKPGTSLVRVKHGDVGTRKGKKRPVKPGAKHKRGGKKQRRRR